LTQALCRSKWLQAALAERDADELAAFLGSSL
jgi:hypothetical protein